MRDSWLKLVDRVSRPDRKQLERCLVERARHLQTVRPLSHVRARALAECQTRIERARADVFAADDGIVTSAMTELEREWLVLSRRDTDGELMDLWARIVPRAWLDRKRWRDAQPEARVEVAIALAADMEGVEAAEASAQALVHALVDWGARIGTRVRWQKFERDFEFVGDLFVEPLRSALAVLDVHGSESVVFDRAQVLEREVRDATLAHFPGREMLAMSLANTAFVDSVCRAARWASPLTERANVIAPMCDLWRTGYLLAGVDDHGVTLAVPALA